MRFAYFPVLLLTGALLASCGSYKQNIMFQVSPEQLQTAQMAAEANYVIQKNDFLTLKVYTNQGEKIIDPNLESFKEGYTPSTEDDPQYLVDVHGNVKFPLIDELKLEGLTLRQAEDMLQTSYDKFYQQTFVVLGFSNKRVVVLGSPGGQVIPLTSENMRLTEVLALAEGIPPDSRVSNIRVIRGNKVFIADLSHFDATQTNNPVMHPGDVVYVEPVRKPFTEGLRDYSPVISIITGLATLIYIITQVN